VSRQHFEAELRLRLAHHASPRFQLHEHDEQSSLLPLNDATSASPLRAPLNAILDSQSAII
jgi:hypothetical protein